MHNGERKSEVDMSQHSNILLLLLLKPAISAQEEKNKLFTNCFRNPASTGASENGRKHNSDKQRTVDYSLNPSNVSMTNTL